MPALLRRPEVEKLTGLPKSSLYRLMRQGSFPEPRRLSARAVAWLESDITAWIAEREKSHGDGPRNPKQTVAV